jgi:hypothetical protein
LKPYGTGGTSPAGKEAFMLDVVFVAPGFAVIAMMGLYATGLLIQIKAAIDFWKGNLLLLGRETANLYAADIPRGCPNLASMCGIAQ